MKRLDGKSALITGAARGIGRGFAKRYIAEGATVAIADINLDAARATAADLGDAAFAAHHVADAAHIDASLAFGVARSARLNLIDRDINVKGTAPGVVGGKHSAHQDAMFAKLEGKAPGQKKTEVEASVPTGLFADLDDLTGMAVRLASPDSDYSVSQTYSVDGGQWMNE